MPAVPALYMTAVRGHTPDNQKKVVTGMGIQKQSVEITAADGMRIVADAWPPEHAGAALAPVVLAHGGGQTRHSWGATAQQLAQAGHRVLSIDLRGHGDSGWAADGDYRLMRFAEDAQAVLDYLGEPVIWVGASLGGMTGMLATTHWPQLFAAIVLVDITPNPAPAGVARILDFMGEHVYEGFASLEEAADAVAGYQPHRPRPKDLSGLEKNLRRGEDGRWRWHWDPEFLTGRASVNRRSKEETSVADAAAALQLPTLLIRGRQSDLVTETEARAFLELVPHAEYVDVVDAAHMVAGDKNDIFTDAVVSFIRRQDAASA